MTTRKTNGTSEHSVRMRAAARRAILAKAGLTPEEVDSTPRYWHGDVPTHCQLRTTRIITDTFIDGRTVYGPWAIMHPNTHAAYGCGLGEGCGQEYRLQADGKWRKVRG